MKIVIPYNFSKIEIDTLYNGSFVIEIQDDNSVFESVLQAVYEVMNTEDFIATLDINQLQEIAEYYAKIAK